MKSSIIILLVVGAAITLEACRLGGPATVILRETWEFMTPTGSKAGTRIVELRQDAAVPYLPGGAVGRSQTLGQDLIVDLGSDRLAIGVEPRWLIEVASKSGAAQPAIDMEGLHNAYTTGFISRVRKSKHISITLDGTPMMQQLIKLRILPTGTGMASAEQVPLDAFERSRPGIKLRRVSYTVVEREDSR